MKKDQKYYEEQMERETRWECARDIIAYMFGSRINMLIAEESKLEEKQDKKLVENLTGEIKLYTKEKRLIFLNDEETIEKALTVYSKIEAAELREVKEKRIQREREQNERGR